MKTSLASTILFLVAMGTSALEAQERRPPEFVSPEVGAERKIVFRIHAPDSKEVALSSSDLEGIRGRAAMEKGENGVWEVTWGPVKPGAYRYRFAVDGVDVVDPRNPATSESNMNTGSLVQVAGSEAFDTKDVPHGAVSEVTYQSKSLERARRMHVYTPPGYGTSDAKYPVFYLLHGASDGDDSWSSVGRAGFILDNLIAAGRAKPMLVVMPHGHTGPFSFGQPGTFEKQMDEFVKDFRQDIRPFVEKHYRVLTDRADRAVAGLSMGGAQTLNIIGEDLADYGYIGVYSSGIFGINRDQGDGPTWEEKHLDVLKNPELKVGLEHFWFATGRDDFLVEVSRDTVALFKKHNFEVAYRETGGGHTWTNWRDYLREFAPMLFQKEPAKTAKDNAQAAGKPIVVVEHKEHAKKINKPIKVIRDIAYREGESKAWRLDLAMPAGQADKLRPALVIVHGGGWRGGSRTVDVFQKMMTDYAKKGYVTVNIDYRLTGEAAFPACIEDVKCAVRWLRAHAEAYQVDPDRIGAYGHSAGAHLAMMLAMVPKSAGLEGDGGWEKYSSLVNAVAAGSPPTELGRDVPMAKKEWWPIGYISSDHPPMFLIQGSADQVVRAELTDDFVEKMKAKGADLAYIKIDGARHGVAYADHLDVTEPAIEKFLAKHLKPTPEQAQAKLMPSPLIVIEDGGTGPHTAVATEDLTLPGMTIYRPRDLSPFGPDQRLPVLLWGNGACANTTQEHMNFLNETASHGYLILAIGLLDQIETRDETSRRLTKSSQLLI